MRVFILCTGRTGSVTIIKACQNISNFSASHESLADKFGEERFEYEDQHIESDNRLSWHLGQLDLYFPEDVFYVHLKRNRDAVANSFLQRFYQPSSIIDSFCEGIRNTPPERMNKSQRLQACYDYIDTVNANISNFIDGKENSMIIEIEEINRDFPVFWKKIGAKGDLDKALQEFNVKHNASQKRQLLATYRFKLFMIRTYRHLIMSLGFDK